MSWLNDLMEDLRDELEMVGFTLIKGLITAAIHVAWFVALIFLVPYILSWFFQLP